MEFRTFGDGGDPDCLFVLGWGNRPSHEPVRWLIDRLVGDGWRVHAATLPPHVTDVQRQWVRPVERYAADLDRPALLGHSAGGLTAAHADVDARTRTYLSPWWGEPPARQNPVVDLLARVPGDYRFLPSGIDDGSLLGVHATERQLREGPDRVSPAFLRATRRAHRTLPRIGDGALVFCSLTDRIVSTRAIGERVPADRTVLYDGGHELFSSRSREEHLPTLLAALEQGVAALD
ncbi:alpha/beta fold hydrolase [Halomicrobium urmianum]|uniref:alpha/beta fold hydrolase n=1 Tax=Halomicrobium urmianum TaxID=1586233 RepID=UPI001CDA36EA|nr:alpha/beta fold hydrolase [Halomicrobium urmianum]